MDITSGFEPETLGSIPSEGTLRKSQCGQNNEVTENIKSFRPQSKKWSWGIYKKTIQ